MVCVVFLLAYGVAIQALVYPHSGDKLKNILFNIFYHPYLSMFQDFESHLAELHGMLLFVMRCFESFSLFIYECM